MDMRENGYLKYPHNQTKNILNVMTLKYLICHNWHDIIMSLTIMNSHTVLKTIIRYYFKN